LPAPYSTPPCSWPTGASFSYEFTRRRTDTSRPEFTGLSTITALTVEVTVRRDVGALDHPMHRSDTWLWTRTEQPASFMSARRRSRCSLMIPVLYVSEVMATEAEGVAPLRRSMPPSEWFV